MSFWHLLLPRKEPAVTLATAANKKGRMVESFIICLRACVLLVACLLAVGLVRGIDYVTKH
jgi:hypothetical protein